jgi:hypothetical protein
MMTARSAKRDAATRFARDARVDLFDGEEAIGSLVYEIGPETATIALSGETYRAARERPRKDEALYQAAIRLASGGEKPPANPILLTDANGRVLARAEDAGKGIAIRSGGELYEFRRRSIFSRRYDLYRQGSARPLGSAGQRSLFSTSMTSDLPSEIPALLRAFLFALLFDMTFVALDRSSRIAG